MGDKPGKKAEDWHSIQDQDAHHEIIGTRCTAEVFEKWNAGFLSEYHKAKGEARAAQLKADAKLEKLSGKQIFQEQAMEAMASVTDDADQKAQSDEPAAGKSVFCYDEDLFGDDMLPPE